MDAQTLSDQISSFVNDGGALFLLIFVVVGGNVAFFVGIVIAKKVYGAIRGRK